MWDSNDIGKVGSTVRWLSAWNAPPPDPARLEDRARGVLLGLAVGNLLGLPVEGDSSGQIERSFPRGLTEIAPEEVNRPMDDDLAQAVDLGEALVHDRDSVNGFALRLVSWLHANGRGCGITTAEVIGALDRGLGVPGAARSVYESRGRIAPNGGVMRCAPVAVARWHDPAALVFESANTCAVTHFAPLCRWSCIMVNAIIARFLEGGAPHLGLLLAAATDDSQLGFVGQALSDGIPSLVLENVSTWDHLPPDASWLAGFQGLIGHTLIALQAGLWAAVTPLGFEEALISLVASGGDTDTNAAVAGAVLGARYGASAIPSRWLACVPQQNRIASLAGALLALNGTGED